VRGEGASTRASEGQLIVAKSWARALILVLAAIGLGVLTGKLAAALYYPVDTHGVTTWCQYLGVGLLLWATIGSPGWSIQTWSGDTPHERLNQRIFRILALLGSYLLAIAAAWPQPGRLG